MKYVALLSGGKDSCFNLVHCSRNGHELIAAASLGPGQGKVPEELDSYMYQTVGQDAIDLVAQALDVPLYKKSISGSAVEQGSEYGTREAGNWDGVKGDETEDLFELLLEVKRNQAELLSEMINSGMQAILIKVAGIGLTPGHLGKTLAEVQPILERLNALYGAHICGEGGEYETLTLDCPMFKRRISLREVETVIHSDNDFATVAYLRVKKASLEVKEPFRSELIAIPPLLTAAFSDLEVVLAKACDRRVQKELAERTVDADFTIHAHHPTSSVRAGKWTIISNLQREPGSNIESIEEVERCFRLLREHLERHSLTLSHLTFVNIYISDMSTFPEVNQTYKSFFGTSPPARACIAVDLPAGVNVRLDCVAFAEKLPSERSALHVQSLSYWAPANIGPYSQAICVDNRIFVSGQIGMRPSSLALPEPPNFPLETALSFQHIHRIVGALQETHGASWQPATQCLIYWLTHSSKLSILQQIGEADHSYASVPTLFIGAKSLPKGAQVETQVIVHTGQYTAIDDEETEVRQCKPIFEKGDISATGCSVHWEVSYFAEVSAFCAILAVKGNPREIVNRLKNEIKTPDIWRYTYSVRLFHMGVFNENERHFLINLFLEGTYPAVTTVPASFIATREGDDWEFALCLIGSFSLDD
ncbi:hypothetical protein M0805_006150 [Coniferiporia weirii]|nr:hypothetical protein M0805_006150 [Coniferiporia weirii]